MMDMTISKLGDTPQRLRWLEQAEHLFAAARTLGADGVGISRASYGDKESATLALLRTWAGEHGLACTDDLAGNGLFNLPGAGSNALVACGSHIDSVPQGGNYDGLAGVIAGLLVLDRLRLEGIASGCTVIALRGEESAWYGKPYLGSSAALGKLTAVDLDLRNKHSGCRLGDAMQAAGADLDALAAGRPAPWTQAATAYLELHIEQGPVMIAQRWPTAIVTGIRGNVRHNRIVCVGQAGHSGAVPRWLRKDAAFALADLLMRMDGHWRRLLDEGADLVLTSGIVGTNPHEHAVSRIPGRVEFSFEARSQDEAMLECVYGLLRDECEAVARERGVQFVFDTRVASRSAVMDPHLLSVLDAAARAGGQQPHSMASGAGHDAAMFANAGIASAMIFVRNEHGSHNPDEAMELDDFVAAVEVLYQAVKALA